MRAFKIIKLNYDRKIDDRKITEQIFLSSSTNEEPATLPAKLLGNGSRMPKA